MDSVVEDHQQSPRVPGGWLGVPLGHSTGRSGEIASLRCMFGGHNFNLNGPPNNDGGSARSECNRWHWKSVGWHGRVLFGGNTAYVTSHAELQANVAKPILHTQRACHGLSCHIFSSGGQACILVALGLANRQTRGSDTVDWHTQNETGHEIWGLPNIISMGMRVWRPNMEVKKHTASWWVNTGVVRHTQVVPMLDALQMGIPSCGQLSQ